MVPMAFGNVEQIAFAQNGFLVIAGKVRKSSDIHSLDVHLTGIVQQVRIVRIVVVGGQFGRIETNVLGAEHLCEQIIFGIRVQG